MNDLQEPPKTIEEIGIHLFYMARDINTLNETIKEDRKNNATIEVTNSLDRRVKKLENRNVFKDIAFAASVITSIIMLYVIFTEGK